MWHRNLRSDSVLVHTGSIGTGAILVPGFGTQPYSAVAETTGYPPGVLSLGLSDAVG